MPPTAAEKKQKSTKPPRKSLKAAAAVAVKAPSNVRWTLRETDVICGRGTGLSSHTGNEYFRFLVWATKDEYKQAVRNQKVRLAQELMAAISNLKPPGRFAALVEGTNISQGQCVPVDIDLAVEKTCQALREKKNVCPDAYKDIWEDLCKKNEKRSFSKLARYFQHARPEGTYLQIKNATIKRERDETNQDPTLKKLTKKKKGDPYTGRQLLPLVRETTGSSSSKKTRTVQQSTKRSAASLSRSVAYKTSFSSGIPSTGHNHAGCFLVLLVAPEEKQFEFLFFKLADKELTAIDMLLQLPFLATNEVLKQSYTALCRIKNQYDYDELCLNTPMALQKIRPLEVLWAVPRPYAPQDLCEDATLLAQESDLVRLSTRGEAIGVERIKDMNAALAREYQLQKSCAVPRNSYRPKTAEYGTGAGDATGIGAYEDTTSKKKDSLAQRLDPGHNGVASVDKVTPVKHDGIGMDPAQRVNAGDSPPLEPPRQSQTSEMNNPHDKDDESPETILRKTVTDCSDEQSISQTAGSSSFDNANDDKKFESSGLPSGMKAPPRSTTNEAATSGESSVEQSLSAQQAVVLPPHEVPATEQSTVGLTTSVKPGTVPPSIESPKEATCSDVPPTAGQLAGVKPFVPPSKEQTPPTGATGQEPTNKGSSTEATTAPAAAASQASGQFARVKATVGPMCM
jgi:hypothetical protein